jgi:DNA-binding MarR family transcriptional regulator
MSTVVARRVMPVFTPSAVSGEHLESITVGREPELTAIANAFKSASTSLNRPNLLLVGPRGSGKSHLISLTMHRMSLDPQMSSRLAIVWLPEDVYTITTYTDLLRTMIRSLGGVFFPNSTDAGLEDTLRVTAGDRVIVLVSENFDRTLNLIGPAGQRSLRAFQHNSGAFMMLASMPAIDEKLLDYDMPFYGAFQIMHLEDLAVEQGRSLLIKTAQGNDDVELVAFLESPTGLARLRAIEHLSGGSPRLWLIISGLMTVELLDDLVPLFLKMLDELTPYYKARMDELAPAKAKVLAVLCRLGREPDDSRPMSVKDIAAECAMSQQTVSKQLHELENARFVRKVKNDKDKRASYYEPREPLLKHCLELKSNKGEPLSLLVSFLSIWFSISELMDRAIELPDRASGLPTIRVAFTRRIDNLSSAALLSEASGTPNFAALFCLYLARSTATPEAQASELSTGLALDEMSTVWLILFAALDYQPFRQRADQLMKILGSSEERWWIAGSFAHFTYEHLVNGDPTTEHLRPGEVDSKSPILRDYLQPTPSLVAKDFFLSGVPVEAKFKYRKYIEALRVGLSGAMALTFPVDNE